VKGLSLLVFLPAIGAGVLLFIPRRAVSVLFSAALGVSVIVFALSLWIFARFDPNVAGMQFVERAAWIPAYGIEYIVGVDGLSSSC
jgi:NADH-quinone oxidoreductase subunit M